MAKHPQILLRQLITKIQPRSSEINRMVLHTVTVRKRLNKSFDLKNFSKIGSHSRGTAIKAFSDVDYMAVLARNEAKWGGRIVHSSSVLNRIRDDLSDGYTNTKVRRDLQAVVIEFGKGHHRMDIVPAIFSKFIPNRGPVFWIPDGYDGWIETSPQNHNSFIKSANQRSGSKMFKVIQLIKWWKVSRVDPIPIQSFHVDMLLAASDICVGIKPYTRCLYDVFQLLAERECRGLRDPLGISGIIYASKTDMQLERVISAVNYALEHAEKAIQAESWKDFDEANEQWSIVFNGYI
jgi:hypothetical protein